jgi:glycosyltransferase involved in cell wall biosynthesis
MPLYNHEKFVTEAMQSVLNQTYDDFELVIVNDASTDNSLSIAKLFADKKIRIFSNPQNKGVSFSCNRGVHESRGDYLAFLASDDMFAPRKLEKQMEVVDKYPDDVVYTNFLELHPDRTPTRKGKTMTGEGFVLPKLLETPSYIQAYDSMLLRKKRFVDVGGFNETLRYGQDYDLALRLAAVANFRVLSDQLHLVRVLPDSLSRSQKVSKKSRHREQLRIIERTYDRYRHLLNKEETRKVKITIARRMIMSRSYRDAFVRTIRDPTMIRAFGYCIKNS